MGKLRTLLQLILDLVLWFVLPAVFLSTYVGVHSVPADAVLPHIRIVSVVLLVLMLARIALSLTIAEPSVRRIVTSVIVSGLLAIMSLYYGAVLIGLESWGRVISWELITSYTEQAPQLADALGVSLIIAGIFLLLGTLALFAASWAYLRVFDWTGDVRQRLPQWLSVTFLLCGSAIVAIEFYSFRAAPWTREAEPLSLTFYPLETALNLQGLAIDPIRAAGFDRREDAARVAYRQAADAVRRNVILIVVDALRPDHMGVYGYGRATTPYLERIDKSGMLRKAPPIHATCASSACGLFSLASSKFAHEFSNRPFLLQEVLKLYGYQVHMVLSGDHTSFYNLKALYGKVDSYFDGQAVRSMKYINDDQFVLDRLAEFPSWDGKPVMFQFHLMSTHLLGKRHESAIRYLPSGNYILPENRAAATGGRPGRAVNYYDNGVVQADATIQRLLELLGSKGYLGNALVVVTGDHGEALGEHGFFQHANSVREEVLRIPLLLVSYGYKTRASISNQARGSQVDIAPTILAELGIPRPSTWTGSPLQYRIDKPFTYFRELQEVGLFDHRDPMNLWKYWIDFRTGEEYAFNLSADPGEQRNLIAEMPLPRKREWRLSLLPTTSMDAAPRPELQQSGQATRTPQRTRN